MLGLGQEVEEVALVELGLADLTALEELLAPAVEGAVEDSEEDADFLGEDLAGIVVELAEDVDILERSLGLVGSRHCDGLSYGSGDVSSSGLGICEELEWDRSEQVDNISVTYNCSHRCRSTWASRFLYVVTSLTPARA